MQTHRQAWWELSERMLIAPSKTFALRLEGSFTHRQRTFSPSVWLIRRGNIVTAACLAALWLLPRKFK